MLVHAQTAYTVIGALYIALPIAAWTLLLDRGSRLATSLWCTGTLFYGVGFVLVGLRGGIPDWVSFAVANPLGFMAWALLIRAMQTEAQIRATPWPGVMALWAILSAGFVALYALEITTGLRLIYVTAVFALCASTVGWLALQLHARTAHRSALLISFAYLGLACALWVRVGYLVLCWREVQALDPHWTFSAAFLASLAAALYGNLGYIGLAMERAQASEMQRGRELAHEHEARRHAELRVREQEQLLQERSSLLSQREEILAALAHEVRQPLNNASAALQSAESVVLMQGEGAAAAGERLRRASEVLSRVVASVDNTLADAVLLDGSQPMSVQDVDVDILIQLVLGDLPNQARQRVRIDRQTATRTAAMHPGLMRIALRNLLSNALDFSPPDTPVCVRIADSDEPLALLIEVQDAGGGLPAEVMQQLFSRGVRGDQSRNRQGHGLGLYIVRRVMELHQGLVTLLDTGPAGTAFRLTIPQDILG
jgi:signal transduction histidine kinase